jgi:CheY-like chemotaxis protein
MIETHVILVVDDDPDIIDVTTAFLTKRGFEVIAAGHGREALQIIRQKRPALILVDVLMPEMDGFTFYKELKKDAFTSGIPVLVMTGRRKMAEAFEVVGVDGFISKPFSPQDLIGEVERILRVGSSARCDQHRGRAGGQPKQVLCISSERIVLAKMETCGQKADILVRTAATLGDSLNHCLKFFPDIIWMDAHFQDYAAAALVAVIRRLPQMDQKTVIVFSYFDPARMDQPEVRQKVLKTEEISRGMIRAGAAKYIGRYDDKIFLEENFKFFKCDLLGGQI